MKKVIGVDLDSVLCNIEDPLINYLKREWNLHLVRDDFQCFEFERNPLLSNVIAADLNEVAVSDWFLSEGDPYKGAKEGIDRLVDNGFSIHIITSRKETSRAATVAWLEKHNLKHDGLYFCSSSDKCNYVSELRASAFVDDRFDTLTMCMRGCGALEYGYYVVSRPWNKRYSNDGNVWRVDGFGHAADKIMRLHKDGYKIEVLV